MPKIPALWVDGSSSSGEVNGDETEGVAIVQIFPHLKKQKGFLWNRLSVRLFNKRKDWRGRKGKSPSSFDKAVFTVLESSFYPRSRLEKGLVQHSFAGGAFLSLGHYLPGAVLRMASR